MFYKKSREQDKNFRYAGDRIQGTLFDLFEAQKTVYPIETKNTHKTISYLYNDTNGNLFSLKNRRYLGNKHKLLNFIEKIVREKCGRIGSFFDIFAGTGVVGERFNRSDTKIISNDLLFSNYACLCAFLGTSEDFRESIYKKIIYLNNLSSDRENYFSKNFGGTYFTAENARKIGEIRE